MAEAPKKIIVTESQVLRRNLLITFVLMFILLLLYVVIPGYNFAVKDIAINSKQQIDQIETRRANLKRSSMGDPQFDELRIEDKLLFKIEDYWYIDFLLRHTPDTAVILLPPARAIDTIPEYNNLNSSEWMEYFLYPRLCVSEDERESKKELYARVTHVAIVNNWGYDKLKYNPVSRTDATVLPIYEPKADSTKATPKASNPFLFFDTVERRKPN
jgi:hypothetical protein